MKRGVPQRFESSFSLARLRGAMSSRRRRLVCCGLSSRPTGVAQLSGYTPQILDGLHVSGMTVRDPKGPYMFLTGGDHEDFQESHI